MAVIRRNQALIDEAAAQRLAGERARRMAEVNRAIGALRERFITPLPGQDMIYKAKEDEARRYLALDPPPETLDGFPFLAAETGILAPTPALVAQTWIGMGLWWREIAARLEGLRMQTAQALRTAASPAEMDAIVAAFDPEAALEGTA
jgi:hypothetical protein